MARDLGFLTRNSGCRVKRLCPVDMFPHTAHIECVAEITRETKTKRPVR